MLKVILVLVTIFFVFTMKTFFLDKNDKNDYKTLNKIVFSNKSDFLEIKKPQPININNKVTIYQNLLNNNFNFQLYKIHNKNNLNKIANNFHVFYTPSIINILMWDLRTINLGKSLLPKYIEEELFHSFVETMFTTNSKEETLNIMTKKLINHNKRENIIVWFTYTFKG
ncbi:hypothetical protein NPX79_03025 [Spiroplasma endosymbiont of Anurida maritima]|uniref:hypothetical protein n=1 Tax=Spiroplasma endosymbiont of Anurida maritima TaxID=2967972 RepID=UPI0036D335B7